MGGGGLRAGRVRCERSPPIRAPVRACVLAALWDNERLCVRITGVAVVALRPRVCFAGVGFLVKPVAGGVTPNDRVSVPTGG